MLDPQGRPMNANIEALLDLQVIDKKRQALKQAREARRSKLSDAEKAWKNAEAATQAATGEVDKLGALVRQYTADSARCDTTIAELRAKQMNAKTNKDYMAIINGIEQAKIEKGMRETSIKELNTRLDGLKEKAAKAAEQAAKLKGDHDQVAVQAGAPDQATPEEQEVDRRYDERKAQVDPAFLEAYERLVKARHKMPLARVDPTTRATPMGVVISHNQCEQIRMGKLVIDHNSNSILYLGESAKGGEKPSKPSESGKSAGAPK
jgi:predicted  nucleic acid-binding Zn-ribbon protein